jgi:hypothetical protein
MIILISASWVARITGVSHGCLAYGSLLHCGFVLSFFFFLVGLEFQLRALHLQSRCSTGWAAPPVHLLWLFWRWALTNYLSR